MTDAEILVEVWRGPLAESVHRGHAVICDASGAILEAWGDPEKTILPRSSVKMLQALPLIESGAAKTAGLGDEHLALACASHQGAAIHTDWVARWLADLDMSEADLRCGDQVPDDRAAKHALIRAHGEPCQLHNNCSGKHSGFLTLTRHLGAGPEYVEPDHPVQRAVLEAFEEMTGETSPGYGIDGCSAPNFACSMTGLARAMARMAAGEALGGKRGEAAQALVAAMRAHPDLVAGEGRACTELMRAMDGRVAIKTGAEAVFTAILPEKGLGIAVKIEDGGVRASECVIAALLVRLGVLDAAHPATKGRLDVPVTSRRGIPAGTVRASDALRRSGGLPALG
ncbi:L-asparaginase [Maritimibacter sp. 55A14]|uniref:asparaginase n=1 Tax=Maritimibacter sp. 55A14 TaxID=2174844 RepID=UPI000D6148F1|nr:asparaginase [Maritimibacter sp. 55A14]PWE33608.1 L-asparaginase [Maritimibacter sp. 55A14]